MSDSMYHHNPSSKRAQDQEMHDFVRDSGLPRNYFHAPWYERIPRLPDGWVAAIVVALLIVGIFVVGMAK